MGSEPSNSQSRPPLAIKAIDVVARARRSVYPAALAAPVLARDKRVLGDLFGLRNFGVNMTTLEPGAQSALMHRHSAQDEFIFVVEGLMTLHTDHGSVDLSPGMCAGFPADGLAHHLANHSASPATYLEIGDRRENDVVSFPRDDLHSPAGSPRRFLRKDGSSYEEPLT